jgi:hypothetical protein
MISEYVMNFKNPVFLTLSYAGHHHIRGFVWNELNKCWRVFMQWLRRNYKISAYIKVVEISMRSYEIGYFHVHAIIDLSDIAFIEQKEIAKAWKRITKTSYVVYIVSVKKDQYIDYVMKYLVKGYDSPVTNRKLLTRWSRVKFEKKTDKLLCPLCQSPLRPSSL